MGPGPSELNGHGRSLGRKAYTTAGDKWHFWGPSLCLPDPLTSDLTSLSQPRVPPGRQAGRSFESQHSSVLGQLPELEAPKSQEHSGTSEDKSRMSVRALAVSSLGTRLEDDNWVPSAEFHSVGTRAKENKARTGHGRRGCLTGCKVTLFTQVWDESPHTLLAFLLLSLLSKFFPPRVLTDVSREPVAGGKALSKGGLYGAGHLHPGWLVASHSHCPPPVWGHGEPGLVSEQLTETHRPQSMLHSQEGAGDQRHSKWSQLTSESAKKEESHTFLSTYCVLAELRDSL